MTLLCTCSCGDLLARGFDRRRFLQMAGGAAAAAAFPFTAVAAYGNYEAMLLSCIDPRTQEPVRAYMFARQRQLHVAQAWIGRGGGRDRAKTTSRRRITGAQRLEPALGLFLERFERGMGSERAAHGQPSFRFA